MALPPILMGASGTSIRLASWPFLKAALPGSKQKPSLWLRLPCPRSMGLGPGKRSGCHLPRQGTFE